MHEQRSAAVHPLSIVMPHPSLPRRRSSRLSSVSDPHTPPPRNSPLPLLSPASNRKSSDSWNSSIYDGADDHEWEWKSEQTRLLSRTLDALPAHLLTPFNGPVPPSNLLDKIAKGVMHAKGPADWPHSLRATRAKIVELARLRAKEDTASDTIAEEENTDPDVLKQTTNTGYKRPLHRQSSMDFMQSTKLDPADDTIVRLSHRLQHTERMIPNPAYHPYVRTSPHVRAGNRTLASSASSTTLNSESSCGSISRIPRLRRSLSSISNSSESYIQQPGVDPRVQRIRRTESFAGSALYPPGSPLKCVPSFGSLAKRHSDAMSVDCSNRSDVTTSDEEEKLRSKRAKKPRVKASSPTPPAIPPVVSPSKPKQLRRTTKQVSKPQNGSTTKDSSRRVTRPKVNSQRNPSILGPELPCVNSALSEPHFSRVTQSPTKPRLPRRSPTVLSTSPPAPHRASHGQTPAPSTPSHKPPRRTHGDTLGRPTVGRKILFGSLPAPQGGQEENDIRAGLGLESAFQLH